MSLVLSARVPGVRTCLALIAKRAYRIEPGRRASPLPDDLPVTTEPTYAESCNDGAGRRLIAEADAGALGKPLTDVLVRGSARSLRGPALVVETGVRVGAARKAVRALGNRRIGVTASGLSFSAPEPFARMPIVWDHAYGGRDQHAESLFERHEHRAPLGGRTDLAPLRPKVIYPRNAAGRGYALDIDRERLDGTLAPNLEDPADPVTPDRLLSATTTDWIDRPVAASYEPIDLFTFPRAAFFIRPMFDPPQRPVHELASGAVLHEDLTKKLDLRSVASPRMFNAAPAGLAVCRLEGGERVSVWNMHARHELLEFELPDDRPKLLLEPPGVTVRELPALLQTVLIEPDEDRVTLTWAGVLPVAMPYPAEMTATMRHAVVWSR
jgi:hypothetical protein